MTGNFGDISSTTAATTMAMTMTVSPDKSRASSRRKNRLCSPVKLLVGTVLMIASALMVYSSQLRVPDVDPNHFFLPDRRPKPLQSTNRRHHSDRRSSIGEQHHSPHAHSERKTKNGARNEVEGWKNAVTRNDRIDSPPTQQQPEQRQPQQEYHGHYWTPSLSKPTESRTLASQMTGIKSNHPKLLGVSSNVTSISTTSVPAEKQPGLTPKEMEGLRKVHIDPITYDPILPPDLPKPFSPCSSYRGVLRIPGGDRGGAAGTIFFQYVINQLIYAEMSNLIPFIHFNNVSQHVWDDNVHGHGSVSIVVGGSMHIPPTVAAFKRNTTGVWPNLAEYKQNNKDGRRQKVTFPGTGVWKHYFQPVSVYDPNDPSCQALPLATMDNDMLSPSMQFFAPWAVRSWVYSHLPPYLTPAAHPTDPTPRGWFGRQRRRAQRILERYYRFQPHIVEQAEALVPKGTSCLAMHIRHSDKAGVNRHKIKDAEFIPYVQAYFDNGGDKVYVATDSSVVLEYVVSRDRWRGLKMKHRMIAQADIVRSAVRKPVFKQGAHHRTNTEVLVEILAMSRCQFLLHGFSAVSEATHYLNPGLHNRSVDLEDETHMSADDFGALVRRVLEDERR